MFSDSHICHGSCYYGSSQNGALPCRLCRVSGGDFWYVNILNRLWLKLMGLNSLINIIKPQRSDSHTKRRIMKLIKIIVAFLKSKFVGVIRLQWLPWICCITGLRFRVGYSHLQNKVVREIRIRFVIPAVFNKLTEWTVCPSLTQLYFVLYICIPTNCTQLIYFINNTLKHMYCLKL